MDSSDWPPSFLGTTVIDLNINADNPSGISDLPTWLREVLDRALFATGIKLKKKVASADAIKRLEHVDLSSLKDKECAICFDPYEEREEKEKEATSEQEVVFKEKYENLVRSNETVVSQLREQHGIDWLQPIRLANNFQDPAFFMPTDESASFYSRFPQRNLYTLEEASLESQVPGYADGEGRNQKRDKDIGKKEKIGHVPVKMPNCDHIFGKSCIAEWLQGNVSCPLCRKEVEAAVETDATTRRTNQIRENSSFVYNTNEEGVVDHLVRNSTDVFNPYRRPVDPYITPLTDSYMHQDWATPVSASGSKRDIESREPNLILPRRFPFHEASAFPVHYPRRQNGDTARREAAHRDPVPNRDDESATPGVDGASFANFGLSVNEPRQRSLDPYDSQSSHSNTGSPRLGSSNGRGGPERSRRNNAGNGRSHPYTRPSIDD